MERSRIGIVVPALNEAGTIVEVVEQIKKYGQPIVVDDGSIDDTAALAHEAGADVVSHDSNQGYDGSLNTGFARAAELGCEFIITIDADGQHDPTKLVEVIAQLENGCQLVMCVRDRFARFGERIFAWCSNFLWGIADPMCGMKGYTTSLYRAAGCFDRYKLIGSELAVRSIIAGCRTGNVDIVVQDRIDQPRFGRRLSANYRIIRAMIILISLYPIRRRSNEVRIN